MNTILIRTASTTFTVLFLLTAPLQLRAADEHHHHAQTDTAKNAGSPLIDEMMKLDDVFKDVVSGVALGDGGRVHKALEAMHGTMEKTHEGVHHGTVKLKKNADRMAEFVSLDKKFHEKLEHLAEAGHKNDQKVMLNLTKELLDGCVQ
jgi:hypothetical protein